MSPEQARGQPVDARTDLWSLGVVFYEMLAGCRPFPGESALALLYTILHDTPAPLPETIPDPARALQRVIDRALAKDPAARYRDADEMRADLQALKAPAASPCAEMPVYLTSFVGRAREIGEVHAILRSARLVTLTGPPGTGKTRLACQLAAELLPEFRDGEVFVALGAITDPALVPSAIAQALGIRGAGQLPILQAVKEHLRERHLLLVLDNFEQILDAAGMVTELVRACPRLIVLVTSRAPLRLSGEREFPVPPLACPDRDDRGSVDAISATEAVALFVERATATRPGFRLEEQNAATVAEICRRLDGLPLAIELAAARVKVLSPKAILARLDYRLNLLTGGARDLPSRHQALRQAIAWSDDLLERQEKQLFRQLSAFVGGHTLEAAEAIAGPAITGADVFEILASLVDKNLLRQGTQADGEPRFAMLETIREFGLECLRAAGEEAETRGAHRDCYLGLVERASVNLTGPQQAAWLDLLGREHENLRVAFDWSLTSSDWEAAERLATGLWRFWLVRGHLIEGGDRLRRLLSLSPLRTPRRAALLTAAGTLAQNRGDYAAARTHHEESLALCRALGDEVAIAGALNDLGWVAWRQGDYAAARALSEEALTLQRPLGNSRGVAHALTNLGFVAHHQGDYAGAQAFHRQSLLLREQAGDKRGLAFALICLGWAVGRQGDLLEGGRLLARALDLLREVGDPQLVAFELAIRARMRCDGGHPQIAVDWLGESTRTFRRIGDRYGVALAVNLAADACGDLERYDKAEELATEALAIRREIGDRWGTAESLATLGRVARARGRRDEAIRLWKDSLAIWVELGDRARVADAFESLGDAVAGSDPPTGGRLLGAADALRRACGLTAHRTEATSGRADSLDDQARAEGALMPLADVVALASALPVGAAGT